MLQKKHNKRPCLSLPHRDEEISRNPEKRPCLEGISELCFVKT